LLTLCRALAESTDGPERAGYQRLEELVRPWLSLRALERADGEILDSLLDHCRQAGCGPVGRTGPPPWLRTTARVVLGASAVIGVVALGLAWGPDPADALHGVWGLAVRAWWTVTRSLDRQRLAALTTLAVAVSIYLVMRLRRY
jgi:hypothetical protein